MKRIIQPLNGFSDIPFSNDPRAAHADITNARELFGDPSDFGDPDDFGDAEYGDAFLNENPISLYNTISGDAEYGAPKPYSQWNKAQRAGLWTGVGLAGAGLLAGGGYGIAQLIKKNQAKQRAYQAQLQSRRNRSTILSADAARKSGMGINRKSVMPFFNLTGAKMNSSPLVPSSKLPADMVKYGLDKQALETPFLQETAPGVFGGTNWVATATGVAAARYFMPLVVTIGINQLSAAPGTVITVTANIPTVAGSLVITTNPFIFTIESGFNIRFLFFPWQLVANAALPVMGTYSSTNPITVTVTGAPANSSVNLVVPGSEHPYVKALRYALNR